MSSTSFPISIVIPTYRRRASVRRLLEALARQTVSPGLYEVIVSIDGSEDGTREMVDQFEAPYRLRSIWHTNRGRASTCNAGIHEATGDLVILLDDDMEPIPGWLEAHWRAHHAGGRLGVVGAAPIPLDSSSPPLVEYIGSRFNRYLDRLAQPDYRFTFDDFYSGNFSIRRTVLHEAGAYDERFALYGHEDTELCLRLQAAGVRIVFSTEALAYQHHIKDFAAVARDTIDLGKTALLLVGKRPETFPALRLSTYNHRSRKWRVLRTWLLALSRLWAGTPDQMIRLMTWLERQRPDKVQGYYGKALDYFFWFGVQSALQENRRTGRSPSSLAALVGNE